MIIWFGEDLILDFSFNLKKNAFIYDYLVWRRLFNTVQPLCIDLSFNLKRRLFLFIQFNLFE